MKLYAYIEPSVFKAYLAEKKMEETEESRASFLREIGTSGILFDRFRVGYVEVSPGSCVRLVNEPRKISQTSAPTPVSASAKSTRKWTWCF